MNTVIKVENVAKQYRLGQVGTGALSHDINRWWHKVRGKEDPYLKIGETNDRTSKGLSEYVWALQDINFEVKQGEVLGIIGRNGAGKSTLLKILSRTTAPTKGSIKVKGRIASLLEVGTGFHPELSGRENVFLNGAILGMSKQEIKSKFDEIVDFAGVERYIDTPVKRYSSGMYVRLAFGVAAHLEPEILIVDEVLAVGDAEFQKKAIGKMQNISSEQGRTVLFVSHNMGSIERLCKTAMIMKEGRIIYSGTQTDSINAYLAMNNSVEFSEADGDGSKELTIGDIQIVDSSNGNQVSFIKSGQDVEIHLNYKINRDIQHLDKLQISVSMMNNRGVKVFTHSNRFQDTNFDIGAIRDNKKFVVKLKELPLVSGTYFIGYSVIHGYDNVNSKENAMEVEIVDSPFYKNIINPHPVHGLVLAKGEWSLQS